MGGLNFAMSKKMHHNYNYYSATVACTSGAQSITIATVPFPETYSTTAPAVTHKIQPERPKLA